MLPDWLLQPDKPVPRTPAFEMQAISSRVHAFLLALINGERSMRDMARVLVEQRLMSAQEAEAAGADCSSRACTRNRDVMGNPELTFGAGNVPICHTFATIRRGSPARRPAACPIRRRNEPREQNRSRVSNNWRGHMGTWTTKFRKPALVAGVSGHQPGGEPGVRKPPADSGSKRGGAGFASGAIVGGAAGGPIGAVVGASVGAHHGRAQPQEE